MRERKEPGSLQRIFVVHRMNGQGAVDNPDPAQLGDQLHWIQARRRFNAQVLDQVADRDRRPLRDRLSDALAPGSSRRYASSAEASSTATGTA